MCGIVGYIGKKEAQPVLLDGLSRLEYRGYDSAGIAVEKDGRLQVLKAQGRLENLRERVGAAPLQGTCGIGHTRWATHGEPSDLNAHPHTDVKGEIAVVHNGIIENHDKLRRYLAGAGCDFVSQTDTEVAAHLLHLLYKGDMIAALIQAAGMLEGSFALGVICAKEPGTIYCMRKDSPLVVGLGEGEQFLASDIPALLPHTRDVLLLEERDVAVLRADGVALYDRYGRAHEQAAYHVDWDMSAAEKGGYPHFMLKEIHEEPEALQKTLTAHLSVEDGLPLLPLTCEEANAVKKLTIAACGTAYHAGVAGKYLIERLARLPVEVEAASEFRYRQPILNREDLFIAVSQSGETADTLAAFREARRLNARCLALCNVVGSTLSREAGEGNVLYTWAGPEIAVASTKAYITQVEMMVLLAVGLGLTRGAIPEKKARELLSAMERLCRDAKLLTARQGEIQRFASRHFDRKHVFYVGRGLDYALCMEASLKLKEVSYIFSEAYAAGELKHGTIALIEPGTLVVAPVTQLRLVDKCLSNLDELKARGAYVLIIAPLSLKERVASHGDEYWPLPDAPEELMPLLGVIPCQLLAYFMAVSRGCDVDKPRNLAKSVTVE